MIVIEREKLYDEVWTDPVTVVAKRYGVSDVGLHKICKSLNVPVPPRGYWAKLRVGKQTERTTLPPADGPTKVYRQPRTQPGHLVGVDMDKTVPLAFLGDEERARVLDTCNTVEMKDRLVKPHPLIVQDREAREERKKRDREDRRSFESAFPGGQWSPSRKPIPGTLDIRVENDQLQRAYRLLDAVFYTIEKVGGSVRAGGQMTAVLLREPVKFRITGKAEMLTLTIDEYDAPRKNWNDTKTKQLESQLGSFVIGLYEYAHTSRVKREEREREEERRRAEAKRRQERAKAQQDEMARYIALENAALDWQKARALESYVAELARQAEAEVDAEKQTALRQRVEWARAKVAWLDPLVAAEDPVLGKRRHDQPDGQKVVLEKSDRFM